MARDEAEAEARRRFGDPRHRKRLASIDRAAARRQRWRARVGAIGDGARFAIRGIARSPGLSLGIVLAFALGIGANATMYGTIDRLLLRPPDHIRDSDRVRRLWVDQHDLITKEHELRSTFTYPDYVELRHASSFAALVAYDSRSLVVGHGETSKEVDAQIGATPVIVNGPCPKSIVRSKTERSPPYSRCHAPYEITATAAPSRTSSDSSKNRPRAGCTPSAVQ